MDLEFTSEFKKTIYTLYTFEWRLGTDNQSQALITPYYCLPKEAHRNLKGKLILMDRKNYHSRRKF